MVAQALSTAVSREVEVHQHVPAAHPMKKDYTQSGKVQPKERTWLRLELEEEAVVFRSGSTTTCRFDKESTQRKL